MNQIVLNTVAFSLLGYLVTLAMARLIGRKLISNMTFFDFVVGVTLGSATANVAIQRENSTLSAIITIITISIVTIILDFGHIKSFFFRKLVASEPLTMVENGRIVDKNMKRVRLTVGELLMHLREKNVFNIADVEFAIMETDGKFSVQPKSQKQPLTPSDLSIPTSYKGLTKDLVVDGRIMDSTLADIKLDKVWLQERLKEYGISELNDVFYAGIDTSGNLYVSRRHKKGESENIEGIG